MLILLFVSGLSFRPKGNLPTPDKFSYTVFSENGGRSDWNVKTGKITFDLLNGKHWDIVICNSDLSEMKNLTEQMTGKFYDGQKIEDWHYRGQPAFSPDGKLILFQVQNEHSSRKPKSEEHLSLGINNDLWIMTSEGQNIQKLTDNPAGYAVLHPHFSYDNKSIVWAERTGPDKSASMFGAWRIKLAEISEEKPGKYSLANIREFTPGGNRWYETHGFSKDGSKIYFSSNTNTDFKASDIFELEINTGKAKNLSASAPTWEEMYNENPAKPGQYSYISSRFFDWKNTWGWGTLRTELYVFNEGKHHRITFFNNPNPDNPAKLSKRHYFIGDHCWSPDGKYILAILAEVKAGPVKTQLLKIDVSKIN
jgi:hypothetical protein